MLLAQHRLVCDAPHDLFHKRLLPPENEAGLVVQLLGDPPKVALILDQTGMLLDVIEPLVDFRLVHEFFLIVEVAVVEREVPDLQAREVHEQ
eukprot:2868086-Pyramimonas_sp.AAC.1